MIILSSYHSQLQKWKDGILMTEKLLQYLLQKKFKPIDSENHSLKDMPHHSISDGETTR